MTLASPRTSLLALCALPFLASSALAQSVDGTAFAQRLQAVTAEQGTPMRYGQATTEGDTVVLTEVAVGEPANELDLGTVRFEGVSGSNEAGWRVERVPFENVDKTDDDIRTRVEGALFEGMTLAPAGQAPTVGSLDVERMAVGSVVVERGGREGFRLTGLELNNEAGEADGYVVDISVDEFVVDTTVGAEGEGAATMAALGYEQIRGNLTGNGVWNTQTGELSLSPMVVDVEDAGELSVAYTITGYTPAFVQALAQAQAQMAANPDNPGSGMAMMGLLSQLSLNSAEIAFQDGSLTDRLLDYYAEQNGQTRDQMIEQLVGALPAVLNYLNNPQFQTEVTQAIDTFLRNPETLTVAVAPAQAVPASQIMAAALGAPQTLPAVLALSVTAND